MKRLLLTIILCLFAVTAAAQSGSSSRGTSASSLGVDAGWRFFNDIGEPECQVGLGALYMDTTNGLEEMFYKTPSPGCDIVQLTSGGVSPVGAVAWAGVTTLTYDGDALVGYAGTDVQCATDTGTGSARVCTNEEIIILIQQGETFGGVTDEVWANGGAPGYTANANDCKAWTEDAAGYYGRYWKLADKAGWMSGCASAKKFACCK